MVYFIENIETKHIKIGFTTDIKTRFSDLQISSPHELKILTMCEGDDKHEKELHKRFNESHYRGEWFTPDKELLDYIKSFPPYVSKIKKYEGLTKLRKEKKMTMESVGKKLKISKQAVHEIEKRYEYNTITIKCLKEYLDVIGYNMTIVFSPK
jgi:DNA-binding XRE family transcriptional regulator